MGDPLHYAWLHRFVCQEPHAPALPTLRCLRAGQSDQTSLRPTIEGSLVDPIGLRAFECRLQTLPAKTLPYALHRGRGGLEHRGYLPVEERLSLGVFAYVSLKQDASAVKHPRGGTTRRDELVQLLPFVFGQFDYVLLHGGSPSKG